MPDPFTTLPAPLPLLILTSVEDLSTPNYLLQASPEANALFNEYHVEVFEAVISYSVPYLQRLIRTIVRFQSNYESVRFDTKGPTTLDYFIVTRIPAFPNEINRQDIHWDEQEQRYVSSPSSHNSHQKLSKVDASLLAVRSLISSAAQIQSISILFFDVFLDWANKIRPSYNLNQHYQSHYETLEEFREAKACPYTPMSLGKPSWVEEQRVYRALWRLEVYFEMIQVLSATGQLNNRALRQLQHRGPNAVWYMIATWEISELETVYEFLRGIGGQDDSSSNTSQHLTKLPTVTRITSRAPESMPNEDDPTVDAWSQAPKHLNRQSSGAEFFSRLTTTAISPLHRTSFRPFARLGFGISDDEKMVRLGLIGWPLGISNDTIKEYWTGPLRESKNMHDYWYWWKSLGVDVPKR